MIDGAILGVFLFALGAAAGMALAAYHYRDVLAGQARCIEAHGAGQVFVRECDVEAVRSGETQ